MENSKSVLVISPDVPFPDNYGGALDIWKRVVYLKSMGFVVHLVSLYRDESRLREFEASEQFKLVDVHVAVKYRPQLSFKMIWYPVAMTIRSIAPTDLEILKRRLLPRYDYALVENSKNMLAFNDIKNYVGMQCGKVYIRMQNCEWEYYDYMASAETKTWKKLFFTTESIKFKLFEKKLATDKAVDGLLFISERDMNFYGPRVQKSVVLPVFLSPTETEVNFATRKNLLLFIGNLELSDNVAAVEKLYAYLKDWLAVHPDCKLLIAGKNKSGVNPFSAFDAKNVEVLFNIPHQQKEQLIEDAKVFCSFSMNPAGVKLKTLEGASAGLPILANNNACDGSGLESVVMNIDKQSKEVIYHHLDQMMGDMSTFKNMSFGVTSAYRQLMNDAANAHTEIFP
jgi:glycosyltransferase involved in cell wall biosynthesis